MNILLYVSVLALSAALLAADAALTTARSVDDTSQLEVIAVGVFLQVGQNRNIDLIKPCIANIARAKVSVHTMTATPLQLDIHVSYVFGFSAQEQAKLDDFLRSLAGVDSVHSATHVNRGFDVAPFLSQLQRTVAAQLSYDLIFKIHTKSNRQWLQHTTQCMCGSLEHVMSILRQFASSPQIGMLAPRGTALGSRSERIKVAPFLLRQLFSEQELWLAFQDSIIRDMTEIWRLIFRDGGSISREDAVVVAGTMFWARLSALQPEQLARALPLLQPSMSAAYRRDGAVEHLLERLFGTMVERFGYTVREMGPAPEIILTLPQGSMCLNNATQRVLHSSIDGVSLSYKLHRSEYVQQHRELVSCATSGIRFMVRVDCSRGLGEETHWRNHFNFISTLLQHRNYITCNGNPVLILELPRQDADRGAMTRLLAVWQDEACFKGLRVGLHVLQHRTSYSSSSSLLRLVTASADPHVASFFMISHYLPWGEGKCGQGRDGGTFSSYDGGGRSKRKTTNDAGVAVGNNRCLHVITSAERAMSRSRHRCCVSHICCSSASPPKESFPCLACFSGWRYSVSTGRLMEGATG